MTKQATSTENWHLIDAEGKILGKVAAKVAMLIRGKHKVDFDPSKDTGDSVVIINAEKIVVTGNKEEGMKYYSHSRHPGGFKQKTLSRLRTENPTEIIFQAVKGMLPKNRTRQHTLRKHLKIYAGSEHPHEAQSPVILEKL